MFAYRAHFVLVQLRRTNAAFRGVEGGQQGSHALGVHRLIGVRFGVAVGDVEQPLQRALLEPLVFQETPSAARCEHADCVVGRRGPVRRDPRDLTTCWFVDCGVAQGLQELGGAWPVCHFSSGWIACR